MALATQLPGPGRRSHSTERRTVRREVVLSPTEHAMVLAAAAGARLQPGSFIATAAIDAAKAARSERGGATLRTGAEVRALMAEVRELRRLLGNVAGNLNDVARATNSTGEVPDNAAAILDYTRRMNTRIDSWLISNLRETVL